MPIPPTVAVVSPADGDTVQPGFAVRVDATDNTRVERLELWLDGEMAADTALLQMIRDRVNPTSTLKGEANVLIMPNLDAANIALQIVKVMADALPVGPILIGPAKPAHILTPSVTARGIVNVTAVAVVEAQTRLPRQDED